jgi:hypothetical protein
VIDRTSAIWIPRRWAIEEAIVNFPDPRGPEISRSGQMPNSAAPLNRGASDKRVIASIVKGDSPGLALAFATRLSTTCHSTLQKLKSSRRVLQLHMSGMALCSVPSCTIRVCWESTKQP